VAMAYPLDAHAHRAIREGVAHRHQGKSVVDPLRPENEVAR
jgi:hypothetical protein